MSALQVMSTTGQVHILDGGYDEKGERRQVRIDARSVGTLPDWAASLPALHRMVASGQARVIAGSLAEARVPNTEPPVKAATNNDAVVMQLVNVLAGMSPEQRAQIATVLATVQ